MRLRGYTVGTSPTPGDSMADKLSHCEKVERSFSQQRLTIAVLLLCQFFTLTSAAVITGTITFDKYDPYLQGRIGVQSCIQDYFGTTDLIKALSCGSPYYNSCICRSDLAATGSSFLTQCINSLCTSNTVDVSQGLMIWDAYCGRTTFTSFSTNTMSIASDDGYKGARSCAQNCIQDYFGNGNEGDLIKNLQCPSPYFDSCICRQDLIGQGVSFLSGCVATGCANSVDVSQATMEYLNYCGYTTSGSGGVVDAAVTSVATTITSGGSTLTTSVSAANTFNSFVPIKTSNSGSASNTASPTETQGASSGNSGGAGLSTSDRIALAVGLGIGIPTLIITILMCLKQYAS